MAKQLVDFCGALLLIVVLAMPPAMAQETRESSEVEGQAAPDAQAQESEAPKPSADTGGETLPWLDASTVPVVTTSDTQEPEEAIADDFESAELDTIVVTASKRIKSQREIPGSVGAIRGDQLEAMRAQGMKDYLKTIPGVVFADQGTEESVPIIRGITTSLSFGFTSVTTGIYMDDMPFADLFRATSVPDLNPFDLDRVEVLKGPQGTLFGSGALAGAVRYIVQKPNYGIWEGKAMATVLQTAGSDSISHVTAAAVNAPLFGDNAALRAVGVFRKDRGLYDMGATDPDGNPLRDDRDADRGDQTSWRALASWDPFEDLKVSAFYFEQKTHNDDVGLADQTSDPRSGQFPFASPRDHDFSGGNLLATYDFSWARLLSSTNLMKKHNYVDLHAEYLFDLERQDENEFFSVFRDDVDGHTQEFRLSSPEGGDFSSWEWLIGVMQMKYKNSFFFNSYLGPDRPDPTSRDQLSDADIATSQVVAFNDQIATETAYFGEVTRKFGAHWEATVGARGFKTELEADTEICGAQILLLFQTLCRPERFNETETGLNPKAALRYLHNRNVQVYLLAAKGFQFGGIQVNPPAPGFPESAEEAGFNFGPYKSSKLWNYELGLRTEWLDRRLRFDVTFFYLDWKDLQLTIAVPLHSTNATFNIIANVGGAHSEGAEVALEVIPFEGARWTSAVAFMNAVTDVPFNEDSPDGPVQPGTRLPGAPHFQWSNVVSYQRALPYFTSWTLVPVLTHVHMGSSPNAIRATGEIGGYDTLDARLSLVKPTSRFMPEISLGVNNLTDVRGVSFHEVNNSQTSGEPHAFWHFVQPRTAVLSISLRY